MRVLSSALHRCRRSPTRGRVDLSSPTASAEPTPRLAAPTAPQACARRRTPSGTTPRLAPTRSPHLHSCCRYASLQLLSRGEPLQADLIADMTMSPMSPKSATPSILIQNDSGSLHNYPLPLHRRPSYPHSSGSMAIPRARDDGPPPPLPPPRYIGEELTDGHDIGWQFGNRTSKGAGFRPGQLASIKPGSSLLGGAAGAQAYSYNRPGEKDYAARKPSIPSSLDDMSSAESLEHSDEDRSAKPRPTLANYR